MRPEGTTNKSVPSTVIIEPPEDTDEMLAREVKMKIMSSIPICDIQFLRKEFLTALKYPAHPFAGKIENLTDSLTRLRATLKTLISQNTIRFRISTQAKVRDSHTDI